MIYLNVVRTFLSINEVFLISWSSIFFWNHNIFQLSAAPKFWMQHQKKIIFRFNMMNPSMNYHSVCSFVPELSHPSRSILLIGEDGSATQLCRNWIGLKLLEALVVRQVKAVKRKFTYNCIPSLSVNTYVNQLFPS